MTRKDIARTFEGFGAFVSNLQQAFYRTLATILFWCAQAVSLGATRWFFGKLCPDAWVAAMFTAALELSALYCAWELWRRWTANSRRPLKRGKRLGPTQDLSLPAVGTLFSVVIETLIVWTYWFDRRPSFALWSEPVQGGILFPFTLVFAALTCLVSVFMAAIEAQRVTFEVIAEGRRRGPRRTAGDRASGCGERSGKRQESEQGRVFALLDGDGDLGVSDIAGRLGIAKSTAKKWRDRWLETRRAGNMPLQKTATLSSPTSTS